jgi:hypothetical protein
MEYKDFLLLNNLKLGYGSKEMAIEDSRGFVSKKDTKFHLPTNFYGNQVQNIAKTDFKGIYLLVGRNNVVFDMLVIKEEILDLEAADIRSILESKKIKHSNKLSRRDLLKLLGIELPEVKTPVVPDEDPEDKKTDNDKDPEHEDLEQ